MNFDGTIYADSAWWRGYRAAVARFDEACKQYQDMLKADDTSPFAYIYEAPHFNELVLYLRERLRQ